MGAMALGLFATLLLSTILSTAAKYIPVQWLSDALVEMAGYASKATGMAIGRCDSSGAQVRIRLYFSLAPRSAGQATQWAPRSRQLREI